MEDSIKRIVYSKNAIEFVTVAREYCAFVESPDKYDKAGFVDKSLKILSLLYLKTLLLPKTELINEEGNEKFVTEHDWKFVKNNIENMLGNNDSYLDFFDIDMNETPEPVTYFISENLADVYQDLKDFLSIYQLTIPELMNDAIYECSQNFESYWGVRVVNSLRILHRIQFTLGVDSIDDEEPENPKESDTSNWFISKAQKGYKPE